MTTPVFRSQVPLFHAADVAVTASLYQKLGLRVTDPDGWCLMIAHTRLWIVCQFETERIRYTTYN